MQSFTISLSYASTWLTIVVSAVRNSLKSRSAVGRSIMAKTLWSSITQNLVSGINAFRRNRCS
ncbi:hypothetical protein D3C86_2096460 [compost metagenome]